MKKCDNFFMAIYFWVRLNGVLPKNFRLIDLLLSDAKDLLNAGERVLRLFS